MNIILFDIGLHLLSGTRLKNLSTILQRNLDTKTITVTDSACQWWKYVNN